jgi:uncharacterized protein (DUF362 family)
MSKGHQKTRRQFLTDAARLAGAASLGGLAGCFPDVGGQWAHVSEQCLDSESTVPLSGSSRVAVVVCPESVVTKPEFAVQPDKARAMLDAALAGLAPSLDDLWAQVFPDYTDSTRIGIKVNCLNQQCATSVPLVKALVDILKSLKVDPERILVWDRRLLELHQCGFTDEAVGAKVVGTIDDDTGLTAPGYGDAICGAVQGKTPRLSRILTDLTDVTINVPVLKTHGVSGVSAAFKNIYGVIDNPSDYHASLVTALPALYRLPPVRRSMRLHVLDAFRAVTIGGTSDPADEIPALIAVSADPLALDSYALDLANQLRAKKNQAIIGPVDATITGWLQGAYQIGLGTLKYELVSSAL